MQCEPDKMLAVGFDQRKRVKNWLTRCGDLTEKFRRLDTNGDGLISAHELRVLADTGEIYQSTVKVIIALADTDNDGNISLAELLQLGTILQENEKLKSELGVVEQASVASILPRVGEAVIANGSMIIYRPRSLGSPDEGSNSNYEPSLVRLPVTGGVRLQCDAGDRSR